MATRSIMVRLQANISDYQREMQRAVTPLDDLVKKSGDAAGEAQTMMGRLAQSARLQATEWRTVGSTLAVAGGAITALNATVAKTGIEYNVLQQTSRAALGTMLGGAEAANRQMDKLDEFARTSPFSKAVFIDAQRQMIGFGIETEKVIPYLSAINETTAAMGGNNQTVAELTRIMSQISASSKITAQDLNQFGTHGVNAAELIGSQMGKTGAQIREEISAGTIDAGEALDALAAGMQESYGGASAAVKETFEGAFDRVKAAWRDLSADLMSSAVSPDGGGWLVDLTNQAADLLRAIEKLPQPVKDTAFALSAVAGVSLLGAGSIFMAVPKIVEVHTAFKALADISPGLASGLGSVARALPLLAAFVAAGEGARRFNESAKPIPATVDEIAAAIRRSSDDIRALDDLFTTRDSGKTFLGMNLADPLAQINDLETALDRIARNPLSERSPFHPGMYEDIAAAEEQIRKFDEALKTLPLDMASDRLRVMVEDMRETGIAADEIARLLPESFRAAEQTMKDLQAAGYSATWSMEDLVNIMAGQLPPGFVMTEEGAKRVEDALADGLIPATETAEQAFADWTVAAKMGANESEDAARAIAEMTEAIIAAGESYFGITTAYDSVIAKQEEFKWSSKKTTQEYLDELRKQVEEQQNWRTNLVQLSSRVPPEIMRELQTLGPEYAGLLQMLTGMTDSELDEWVRLYGEGGKHSQDRFADGMADLPTVLAAIGRTAGADAVAEAEKMFASGKYTIQQIIDRYDLEAELRANDGPARATTQALVGWANSRRATVKVDASTSSAIASAQAAMRRISGMRATVQVGAMHRAGLDAYAASGGYMADIAKVYGLAGGGFAKRFPAGGMVHGPGTSTSDDIPTWLSDKEFVQRGAAVSHYGVDTMHALNSLRASRELVRAAVGLAEGGQPYRQYAPTVVPATYHRRDAAAQQVHTTNQHITLQVPREAFRDVNSFLGFIDGLQVHAHTAGGG